jgi:hypothetical protein
MSHPTVLFHVSPVRNLRSIGRFGLLPSLARAGLRAVWLVSRSRLTWAIAHVRERHSVADVVVFRVAVSRSSLVRRRRGVWSSASVVLPSQIVSVRPPAFAA